MKRKRRRHVGGNTWIDLDARDRELKEAILRQRCEVRQAREALGLDWTTARRLELACVQLGRLYRESEMRDWLSRKATEKGELGGRPRKAELANAIAEIESTPNGKRRKRIEELALELEIEPESLRTMYYRR